MNSSTLAAAAVAAFSLIGCCAVSQTLAPARAPEACSAGLVDAPTLELPAAKAPPDLADGKGQPYRFATAVPVNRTSREIGRSWTTGNWRIWQLGLYSPGARSLSVHLQPLALPAGAQLWLCGAEGVRQGPYRADAIATTGELWTPSVPGPRLWLELSVPESIAAAAVVGVAEAFPAFR